VPASTPRHLPEKSADETTALGRTPQQRAAELFAGIRAEIMPSPLTKALSRAIGRTTARIMISVFGKEWQEGLNFPVVRTAGLAKLIYDALSTKKEKVYFVELGAGFSPRGVELALALPHAEVIEIDLPDIVQEKRFRVSRIAGISPPPNLHWQAADLAVTSLTEILDGQRVDAIVAEGFLFYFPRSHQVRICQQVCDNLVEGGLFAADLTWHEGLNMAQGAAQYFSQRAGRYVGTVASKEQAESIFREAGFSEVNVYLPSEVAEKYDLPRPVFNAELLVVGKK
jgi:O-methyltransferase involved in polyketide biosynthesis